MSKTYWKKECFKPTSENWHGNYRIANDGRYLGGFVNVSVFPLGPKFELYRVLVEGNDDFAMEYDTKDMEKALSLYSEICLFEDVKRRDLEIRGFIPF